MRNIVFLFSILWLSGCAAFIDWSANGKSCDPIILKDCPGQKVAERFQMQGEVPDPEIARVKSNMMKNLGFYRRNAGKKVIKIHGEMFRSPLFYEKVTGFMPTFKESEVIALQAYGYCINTQRDNLLTTRECLTQEDTEKYHQYYLSGNFSKKPLPDGREIHTISLKDPKSDPDWILTAKVHLQLSKAFIKNKRSVRGVEIIRYEEGEKIRKPIPPRGSQGVDSSKMAFNIITKLGLVAMADLANGKALQRKEPENQEKNNKIFNEGSREDRTKDTGVITTILLTEGRPSVKRKGKPNQKIYFDIPVRITGITTSTRKTIQAKVILKVRRYSSCENFGCGRRQIIIDTYEKDITLHTKPNKKSVTRVWFNVLLSESNATILKFQRNNLSIRNLKLPHEDIRATIEIKRNSH